MLGKTEPPESAKFLHNELEKMGEYLCRQESSEKTIVSGGKCFRTPGRTGEGDESLQCAEECSEHVSEREGQLQSQVLELEAKVDELSRQLAEAHITYPEADLSSDKVSESLSRVEEAVLIRSQSVPEQLLVAHKKIEVLEVTDAIAVDVCLTCTGTVYRYTYVTQQWFYVVIIYNCCNLMNCYIFYI